MSREDAVAREDSVGLGTCGNPRGEEGPRRSEFPLEERALFLNRPVRERFAVEQVRRGEELVEGPFVKGLVLPHIESGGVESEGREIAAKGDDLFLHDCVGADLEEGVGEGVDVVAEFRGMDIGGR